MEENLDPIIDVNKKSNNTNKSKSEEIKEPSSEKLNNVNKERNNNLTFSFSSKNDIETVKILNILIFFFIKTDY